MMARKKLLLLKGAGSSVEYGIPGTKEISDFLEAKSTEWAEEMDQPNYYMEAFRAASLSRSGPIFDLDEASFEDALGLFPRLMSWKTQARDPFYWLVNNPSLRFSINCEPYDDFMPRISIRNQYIF